MLLFFCVCGFLACSFFFFFSKLAAFKTNYSLSTRNKNTEKPAPSSTYPLKASFEFVLLFCPLILYGKV